MKISARISRSLVGGVGLIALIWGVTQGYEIYQRPWKLLYERYPGRHWARKDQQGAYLRPKVVVFNEETGRRDVIHYRLPAEIRADSPSEVHTIVFASRSKETDSTVSYRGQF